MATVRKRTKKAPKAPDAPAVQPRLASQSSPSGPPLPENFHALYDRGFRAARGIAPKRVTATATAGHRRLGRSVKGLDVQYDQTTQMPNMIRVEEQPEARLSRRAGAATAEGAALDFIKSRGDLWNLSDADAAAVEVVSVSQPRAAAATRAAEDADFNIRNLQTVNLIQKMDGKEIFNSDVTAALDGNNRVLSMAGQFFPGGSSAPRARTAAASSSSEQEAIARAAFDLTSVEYRASDFKPVKSTDDSGPYREYEFKPKKNDKRPAFERPVRLKDVMFPLGEGEFVPGYYMELWISGFEAFAYVMDAVDTPDLLYRKNLTSHAAFSYRVHNTSDALFRPEDGPAPGTPHPAGIPNGFQAKPIKEKLIKIESLLAGDPWLPPNAKTTEGNNCFAYADLKAPNGFSAGDVVGKITSDGVFDYTFDHTKAASTANNLQNSLVGMFFHVNWLHDRWYEAGFDEASGNAQKNNFGRGGAQNDPVLAEGNDFSGTDNANMSTPADGASPRMQMFEFKGPGPISRTSNHEALITFHEMGHYITNRLVGNANGLTNQQGGAMGEGWGDFFAACMTSQATDNFAKGTFAVGGWTDVTPSFKENYYFSIRRYPYTADMKKNPLTFKHISSSVVLPSGPVINPISGGPNNEVHNAGEVWCTMLWEVFVNLVAKHGHATAEKRMLAYVIGGLKLTPPRPTFVQARDGIISAVTAMSAADLPEVKAGFAKRGIGKGAVAPPSNSTTLSGVVESFTP
jgi:extracellular elastinolytic metalloproteinase